MANGENKPGKASQIGNLIASLVIPGFGQGLAKYETQQREIERQQKEQERARAFEVGQKMADTGNFEDIPLLKGPLDSNTISALQEQARYNQGQFIQFLTGDFGASGAAPAGATPAAPSEYETSVAMTVGGAPRATRTPKSSETRKYENLQRWERNIAQLRRQGMSRKDAIMETYNTPGYEVPPDRFVGQLPAGGAGFRAPSATLLPTGEPPPSVSRTQPVGEPSQLREQPDVGTTTPVPLNQGSASFAALEDLQPRDDETTAQFEARQKAATKALAESDLPITDPKVINLYRDRNGQPPPLGITPKQLIDQGYVAVTPQAAKLKGGSLSVLAKMASVWEKEFRGSSRFSIVDKSPFGRFLRRIQGTKEIQDVLNFQATLGNLIQDIADEGRRVSDADAQRFKNLIFSLWDNDETSFSKMVYVTQMLERSYIGAGKPVPKELMDIKKRYNIPTIEVAPDPSIPLEDAIVPGRAMPSSGPIQLPGFEGFSLGPERS